MTRRMKLTTYLFKYQDTIVERWFDIVAKTYPSDTAGFLRSKKDPFANPVRNNTLKSMRTVVAELLGEMDCDLIRKDLDPAVRIRAVQQFSPSEAVGFIFFLKDIIRELLRTKFSRQFSDPKILPALLELESRIDAIALIAVDIYLECREKIYSLKANVERNTVYKAFHRAGLVVEDPDEKPHIRPV